LKLRGQVAELDIASALKHATHATWTAIKNSQVINYRRKMSIAAVCCKDNRIEDAPTKHTTESKLTKFPFFRNDQQQQQ
jgi:hypothetical protein